MVVRIIKADSWLIILLSKGLQVADLMLQFKSKCGSAGKVVYVYSSVLVTSSFLSLCNGIPPDNDQIQTIYFII